MLRLKRIAAVAASAALAACMAVVLAACGNNGVAATWEHGDVKEDDVTTRIESMRSQYVDEGNEVIWKSIVADRLYDPDAQSDDSDSDDSSKSDDSSSSEATDADNSGDENSEDSNEGTVADLREYVITQMARNDVAIWEAQQRDIEVSDEEVDAFVDEYKKEVEDEYMAGTFESILQRQGYKDVEAYREQVREKLLAVYKLQEEVTGGHKETDSDWEGSEAEDKWDEFVDGLMAWANLHINEMPSGLPYDSTAEQSDSDSDSDSDENAEDAESADDAAADDADATADDADAEADGSSKKAK